MPINQIISQVKSLLLKGKVSKALTALYTFLEKDSKYDELTNTTLQLKSKFAKFEQDKARNIIPFEKAQLVNGQVTNSLIHVLDQLEKGEFSSSSVPKKLSNNKKWLIPVVTILLLAAAYFGYKQVTVGDTSVIATTACPTFEKKSDFNILILPFTNFGEKAINFDLSIKQRFDDFKRKLKLKVDTEIYTPAETEKVNPTNGEEAEKFITDCKDDIKLVLWGSYEKQNTNTIVTTRYKFLNTGKQFSYGLINVAGDFKPVTVNSISSIATEGSATGDIEALLLGIAAHQMGDKKSAIAILSPLTPSDSATSLLWGMTLADSYLSNGFKKKAIESYDKVLDRHPDYRFALINRSQLNFQNGNTESAIEDLSHHLKKAPNDKEALYARAAILVQSNQLKKASSDISSLEKIGAKKRMVPLKNKYQKKYTKEKKRQKRAKEKVKAEPSNLQALDILSESSLRLGEYNTALKAAELTIKKDPKNVKARAVQLRAMKALKMDNRTIISTFKKAEAAGISRAQLKKASTYMLDNNK